jgi:hypothetical protein
MQLLQSWASVRTWSIQVRTCSSCSPPGGTVRVRVRCIRKLFMLSISSLMNWMSSPTRPSSTHSLRITPSSELTAPDASSAMSLAPIRRPPGRPAVSGLSWV